MKTARLLIIGNEILSGRTQDTNSRYLASQLHARGIKLEKIEVYPDEVIPLAQWVRDNCNCADYIFVVGGIGATPDDVTREAVARGLGVKLSMHPQAEKLLRDYYKEKINDNRLRMAQLPEGCELIDNPSTFAPGIRIKNIFVMAGIPRVLQSMFESIKDQLSTTQYYEVVRRIKSGEGEFAHIMSEVQKEFADVAIGSYPTLDRSLPYRAELVFGGLAQERVLACVGSFEKKCEVLGDIWIQEN